MIVFQQPEDKKFYRLNAVTHVTVTVTYMTNRIIKNHTHVKKMGHTSEFHFGIYWWTMKNLKNQNFEKMKKKLLEISFYTCVPKATIIWGTVPEIRSETNFLVILGHFLAFTPPPPPPLLPENQYFLKLKKPSGDVITLNLWNKKRDQMMYAYSDMECDRHFCHFRPIFPLLPHYWSRKLKFRKIIKKHLEILSFYTCAP